MSNKFFAAFSICPDEVQIFNTREERDAWVFDNPNEGLTRCCLTEAEARALIGNNIDEPTAYYEPNACEGETWVSSEYPDDYMTYLAGKSPTVALALYMI